jgi:hypothetical protein
MKNKLNIIVWYLDSHIMIPRGIKCSKRGEGEH